MSRKNLNSPASFALAFVITLGNQIKGRHFSYFSIIFVFSSMFVESGDKVIEDEVAHEIVTMRDLAKNAPKFDQKRIRVKGIIDIDEGYVDDRFMLKIIGEQHRRRRLSLPLDPEFSIRLNTHYRGRLFIIEGVYGIHEDDKKREFHVSKFGRIDGFLEVEKVLKLFPKKK